METEKYAAGIYYNTVILNSKWMEVKNFIHSWSFSANIVLTNGRELIDALEQSTNPELMVPMFWQQNEGASKQFHREVNRLVHNYVCSVSSYADHSRNMISTKYANKAFKRTYESRVETIFQEDKLCRFVRDMRNYISHRGLPDSKLTLKAVSVEDAPHNEDGTHPVNMSCGVTYGKERFLGWRGWTKSAKSFLEEAEDEMSIENVFKPHLKIMDEFHKTVLGDLELYHERDFWDYEQMLSEYRRLDSLEKN